MSKTTNPEVEEALTHMRKASWLMMEAVRRLARTQCEAGNIDAVHYIMKHEHKAVRSYEDILRVMDNIGS
jgi:hypothetical protein